MHFSFLALLDLCSRTLPCEGRGELWDGTQAQDLLRAFANTCSKRSKRCTASVRGQVPPKIDYSFNVM